MPATLRHFAINADNVQRAKAFYEKVFGWTFSPWGPPDFYQVKNAGTGLIGALQERRDIRQRQLDRNLVESPAHAQHEHQDDGAWGKRVLRRRERQCF